MSTYDILNGENYTVLKRLTCTECHLYQRCIRGEFSLYRVKAVSLNKEFHKSVSSNKINNPNPHVYFSKGPSFLRIIHQKAQKILLRFQL